MIIIIIIIIIIIVIITITVIIIIIIKLLAKGFHSVWSSDAIWWHRFDLTLPCLRSWVISWRQEVNIWPNVDLSSNVSAAFSWEPFP